MQADPSPPVMFGAVAWTDLSVPNPEELASFYQEVAGWQAVPVEMEGHTDYHMVTREGEPTASICHPQGVHQGLPPVWMVYVVVPDIQASVRKAEERGGRAGGPLRGDEALGWFCPIQDPAGAWIMLFQPPTAGAEDHRLA